MILSILVPTLRTRRTFLQRLVDALDPQLTSAVKLVLEEDKSYYEGGPTIGLRRQRMLAKVETPYVCFFDDDDLPSKRYVPAILEALRRERDVVGFRLRQYTDGDLTGLTVHSLAEKEWRNELAADGLYRHYRTPNHLNPVRTELARKAGFPNLRMGEDAEYSRRLYPLLKSEVFVDEVLYEYWYRTPKAEPTVLYDEDGRLTESGMRFVLKQGGTVSIEGRLITRVEEVDELFAAR